MINKSYTCVNIFFVNYNNLYTFKNAVVNHIVDGNMQH